MGEHEAPEDRPAATDELLRLASVLADWAADARGYIVYLFGSRVRGDHRSESDVDVHLALVGPIDEDTVFWKVQNEEEDYASIKSTLPGPLKILAPDDPLCRKIEIGALVHVDRNVRCVWLPPKPTSSPNSEA